MADYWRVSPNLWAHARREGWGDDERALALYLLTCPHRTTEGLFWLPKAYAWADLGWDAARLTHTLNTLVAQDFVAYDDRAEVILIVKAMKYQRPDNENQQKAAAKALQSLPNHRLWNRFFDSARAYAKTFADYLEKALPEGFGKGLPEGSGEASPEGLGEAIPQSLRPSPSPSPSPSKASPSSAQADRGGDEDGGPDGAGAPQRIMDAWNERWVPDPWAKALRLTDKRRKHIQARLKTFTEAELLEAVRSMRLSPYHCGQNDRGWVADPEFLFREDGQVEKFLNRQPQLRPVQSPPARASPDDDIDAEVRQRRERQARIVAEAETRAVAGGRS